MVRHVQVELSAKVVVGRVSGGGGSGGSGCGGGGGGSIELMLHGLWVVFFLLGLQGFGRDGGAQGAVAGEYTDVGVQHGAERGRERGGGG